MTDDKRLEVIRKLLAKAEAEGTTPEEREALGDKASELMIKYGIDEAVARAQATGEVRTEKIIDRILDFDVPQSYSHEYAVMVVRIAEALGCRGFLLKHKRTQAHIVGFESDVELATELAKSILRQCTLNLAVYYRRQNDINPYLTGTQKFNIKKGFIVGYGHGVTDKMRVARSGAIKEAGHGAELVLVDRALLVKQFMDENFSIRNSPGRRYTSSAMAAGRQAGAQADIGQGTVNANVPRRNAIGG